jgi:hypothetical protein
VKVEEWQAVVVGKGGGLIDIAGWRDKQWCRCSGMVGQLVMVEEWQAVVVGECGGVTGSAESGEMESRQKLMLITTVLAMPAIP